MEAAECICVVARTSELGVREESYMNQIFSSCGDEAAEKVLRVENAIPEDRNPVDIRAALEGDFGQMISNLTDRIVNVVK